MKRDGWLSALWHAPGRAWAGALKAAPWRHWVQAIGALTFTAAMVLVVLIAWRGGWPAGTAAQRLALLAHANLIFGFLVALNVLAITDLAINLRASRGGIEFSSAGDDGDDTPPPLARSDPVGEPDTDRPPWERRP